MKTTNATTKRTDSTKAANDHLDEAIRVARAILNKLEIERTYATKDWSDAADACRAKGLLVEAALELSIAF